MVDEMVTPSLLSGKMAVWKSFDQKTLLLGSSKTLRELSLTLGSNCCLFYSTFTMYQPHVVVANYFLSATKVYFLS